MLTKQEIEHLASLAKLDLSEEEKDRYARDLSGIVEFVAALKEVDTDGVVPTSQVTGLVGQERADVVLPSSSATRERLLAAAPRREGDQISVPPVFTPSS